MPLSDARRKRSLGRGRQKGEGKERVRIRVINEEDQYKQINTPLRVFGSIMVTSAKVSTNAKADMAVEYQVQQELIHTTTHFKLHVSVSLFFFYFFFLLLLVLFH